MIICAPLAHFDVTKWLISLQHAEVSPQHAMTLYHHLRMCGCFSARAEHNDASLAWDDVRTKFCKTIVQIASDSDARAYIRYPLKYIMDEQNILDFRTTFSLNYHAFHHTDEYIQGWWREGRGMCAEYPRDLDWDDVWAHVAHDAIAIAPSDVRSEEEWLAHLEHVVQQTGLLALEWPLAGGWNTGVSNALVDGAERANQELNEVTHWDKGVLGLNTSVVLQLGKKMAPLSGYCASGCSTVFVCTSNTDPLTPIAHEWFHALDYILNEYPNCMLSDQVVSETHPCKKDLNTLLNGLTASDVEGDCNEVIAQVYSTLEERLDETRYSRDAINLVYAHLQFNPIPDTQSRSIFSKLEECLNHHPHTLSASYRAAHLAAHVDLLCNLRHCVANKRSMWVEYAQRCQFHMSHSSDKMCQKFKDYLLRPSEQLAHSFEVMGGENRIAFSNPTQSLRWPLEFEQNIQRTHWNAFFAALQPWWNAKNGVVSLKNKIDHKRQGAPQQQKLGAK